ncbi:MAG TPA: FtsW/RodA/SpoVE family cell cycle protein, partial [Gemmatimonadales bacterium]|nr:FtsW/RodA/SpoVE family cell cycle protein [Gemmatimonadales bacterium]
MRRLMAADRPLLLVTLALLAYGALVLYSAGQTDIPTPAAHVWERQLVWIGIGIVAALFVMRLSPRVLEWVAPALYGFALVLLMLTLLVGTGGGTAAGTRSWLAIGGVRIGQPAEFAKLATVLMLARFLAGQRGVAGSLRELLAPVVIAAVPAGLVALQPDLGSALVFAGILFAMLFWAGTPLKFMVMLASPILSLVLAFSSWSWGAWIFLLVALLFLWRPFVWEGLAVMGANLMTGVV